VANAQTHSGSPACANACSANSSNLQKAFDSLAEEASFPDLDKKEKKQIEDAAERFERNLLARQKKVYSLQYEEFQQYSRAYKRLFKKELGGKQLNGATLMEALRNPGVIVQANKALDEYLEKPVKDQRSSQKRKAEIETDVASLRMASKAVWYRDSELKDLMVEAYESDAKGASDEDTAKIFEKAAKKHFDDPTRKEEMTNRLTQQYLKARERYFDKWKKTAWSEHNLKNLDISFSLEGGKNVTTWNPSSEEYSKMTVQQITDAIKEKSREDGFGSLYCWAVPANEKNLKGLHLSSQEDPPSGSLPLPSREPAKEVPLTLSRNCDLKQTFDTNEVEVDPASKTKLLECVQNAKSDCPNGIESMKAHVQSCADTRRSGNPVYPSNLALSEARAKGMARAFKELAKGELNFDVDPQIAEKEERMQFENAYEDAQGNSILTGTCGPRPPAWMNSQGWMRHDLKDPDSWSRSEGGFCTLPGKKIDLNRKEDPYSIAKAVMDQCIGSKAPRYSWKCVPKLPVLDIGALRAKKNPIDDFYMNYRKANIRIQYTCKRSKPKPGDMGISGGDIAFSENNPKKHLVESSKCGVFVKCLTPRVSISASEPSSSSGSGKGFIKRTSDWVGAFFGDDSPGGLLCNP
jgi:hypothetical protein